MAVELLFTLVWLIVNLVETRPLLVQFNRLYPASVRRYI